MTNSPFILISIYKLIYYIGTLQGFRAYSVTLHTRAYRFKRYKIGVSERFTMLQPLQAFQTLQRNAGLHSIVSSVTRS